MQEVIINENGIEVRNGELEIVKNKVNPKSEIKIPKYILDKANIIYTQIDKLL